MSKLYNLACDVITSSNLDEAEEKLYGTSGIRINSEVYFENIVSNFIRKKEQIIRKENNNLVFDLNNYNDIWSIIFLGEYIKENDVLYKEYNNLLLEINNIKHNLEIIKNKHRTANTREEHERINEEYRLLKTELDSKNEIKDNYKNVIDTFYKIDWVKLENTDDEIERQEAAVFFKQSVNIIHKLRNSFQHGRVDACSYLEINDDNFSVSIPIEYLDGFGKGRIIANEEDRIIVERTNLIASPLLESLDYDVNKVESFFYNVNPEYLNFLLEQVGYNYDELYKLTTFIYMNENTVKEFLKNGLDLNYINKLPLGAFHNYKFTLELFNRKINMFNWPSAAFKYPDSAMKLYEAGINLSELPNIAFDYPIKMKELFNRGIDISKLSEVALDHSFELIKLHDSGFNIYELSDDIFENSESAVWLHNNGLDIKKLPHMAFLYPEETVKLLNYGIDIKKLPISALQNLFSSILLHMVGLDIYKLPNMAFKYSESVIKLYKSGINVYELSNFAFKNPEATIKLTEKGIDVYRLGNIAFENSESVLKLYEEGINIYEIWDTAFFNPELLIKLIQKNIDVSKLPSEIFELKVQLSNDNVGVENSEVFNSILFLFEKGINIYEIPSIAFKYPDLTIRFFDEGIDLSELTDIFFYHPDVVFSLYEKGIDIYKIPRKCYFSRINIKNIQYLLELVDNSYEKLEEFPIEFFTCDIALIEDMYKKYNLNIARGIFGINNPKLIATIIYCNSVFKKYQKENGDCDIISFAPTNFIRLGYENTLNFKNNINDLEMDRESYLNQFTLDYNGNYRDQNSIKSNILDKLRNSICHFRFKPVKDSEGNIIEDKIYLYDKFDNCNETNFNMILDLQDLVDIARKIELDLKIRDNNVDNKAHEENILHRNRV